MKISKMGFSITECYIALIHATQIKKIEAM